MKLFLIICFYVLSIKTGTCISNLLTWDAKKFDVIDELTDEVMLREKFFPKCYKDGHGYSIGYGDFSLCTIKIQEKRLEILKILEQRSVKFIKFPFRHNIWNYYAEEFSKFTNTYNTYYKEKNKYKKSKLLTFIKKSPFYKKYNDDVLRKTVTTDKVLARKRLRIFLIECYDNFEVKKIEGKLIEPLLDKDQIKALIDNMYTRGEPIFYASDFYKITIAQFISKNKINCIKTAHTVLSQSKGNNGVLARRLVELIYFTHKNCVYDIKFLMSALNKYYKKS